MARTSAKLKDDVSGDESVAGETENTNTPTVSLFGSKTSEQPESEAETASTEEGTLIDLDAVEPSEEPSETISEPVASATTSDLDSLSVEDLRKQQEEITRRLDEKTNAEKKGILDQVVLVIAEYGITTEEVVNALGGYKPKRKGTPAKIKYRDSATGAEWSGRGKEPLWIKGKDRAEFTIA